MEEGGGRGKTNLWIFAAVQAQPLVSIREAG